MIIHNQNMTKKQNCFIGIQFHCIHKSRWYLQRYSKDIETRLDTSKYELDRTLF